MKLKIFIISFCFFSLSFGQLPNGFVYVNDVIPNIKLELRYCTQNNFVGTIIDGYKGEVCILSANATKALKLVQTDLNKQNLSIKIYDAYRPQRAVNHFWKWAQNVNDTIMKQKFYPNVDKKNLFKEEYIASRSGHSRGSTLDITLVDLLTGEELDMGSPYDFFGKESWVENDSLTTVQKSNRMLLQNVMKKYGFINYPKEWWHFTLYNEPFPDIYFDFPIE